MGRKLLILAICSLLIAPSVGAAPGVGRRSIKIGIHAPLTGASPVPTASMQEGTEIYWRWLRRIGKPVHRRHVSVVLKNDQYNPSTAVAVCREMVEDHDVFTLVSPGPSHSMDQITSCARYAESVGVPYVSIGTAQHALPRLDRYFSVSRTLERQAPLLASFLVNEGARSEENALVVHDTAASDPFVDRFVAAMEDRRAEVDVVRRVAVNAGTSEAQAAVAEMALADVRNVVVLVRPTFFIQLLSQAEAQSFFPLWTGPGLTMSTDPLANVVCGSSREPRARFFSPLPAFRDRDRFDRRFDRGYEAFYSGTGDDTVWLGWAFSKALRDMLDEAGRRLTRRGFVRQNERGGTVGTGIFPRARFTRSDHFGGRAVHVLRLDCSENRWVTARRSVRRF